MFFQHPFEFVGEEVDVTLAQNTVYTVAIACTFPYLVANQKKNRLLVGVFTAKRGFPGLVQESTMRST